VEKGRFLGIVSLTNLLPNIYSPASGTMILVDRQDRLVGFNDHFFTFFKKKYRKQARMLSLPCEDLFSPGPARIQREFFAKPDAPDTDFPEPPVFRLTARSFETGKAEHDYRARFSFGNDGAAWTHSAVQRSWLTLLHPMDTSARDFQLELEFDQISGYSPRLLLGDSHKKDPFLDTHGYALGCDDNKIFLKKYGFVIASSSLGQGQSKQRKNRYRMVKAGTAFFFYINGRETIRHHDFDFIRNQEAHVSLALLPGSSIRIRRLSLSEKKSSQRLKQQDQIIRLNAPGSDHFAISHFFNSVLSINYPEVSGYLLRNITALKETIDRFQNLYLSEKREGDRLRTLLSEKEGYENMLVGESESIQAIRERAETIAGSNATVLIQGETGTGKEVLAHYIHSHSSYKEGPFVKVDCSTLAPTLIESELFGHQKGAFTGAVQDKKGKFELANQGTLFLDEVNNLGSDVQAKILNFLQDFSIYRVGGQKPINLDLRIIIASNIPLEEMVRHGLFRQDLFFRINILNIELPPLRERVPDIPMLCEHFLGMFNRQYQKSIRRITSAAYRKLYDHPWHGNVRELRNVIYHAVIFCEGEEIDEDLIRLQPVAAGPARKAAVPAPVAGPSGRKTLGHITRQDIVSLVKKHRGNVKRTAEALGITRPSLYYNFRKFRIDIGTLRKK
jgi:transcriptional regulator with PAS, ATPase and Fis domain